MTRFGLFLVVYLSLIVLPLNSDPGIADAGTGPWRGFPENLLLDGWARWDSAWYKHIAEHGYLDVAARAEGQKNIVFFPLYPLVIRGFNIVLHNSFLSGIVVSNLAFLTGVLLLYQMIQTRYGVENANKTILLLSVFPFSFYFSAVYTESIFFLLVIASFYFAGRRQWWLAAVLAMFSGATRLAGVALFPALVLCYLEWIQFDLRKIRLDFLWLALSVLGPAVYALYLYADFGDPLLFLKAQQAPGWLDGGVNLKASVQVLGELLSVKNLLTGNFRMIFAFNLLTGAVFYLSVIPVLRRQGASYAVFSLLLVLLGTSLPTGLGRYVLAAFPVFLAWALLLNDRVVFESTVVVSSLLLALLTVLYSHWYWVT
jgi:hypothetical protein